MSRHDNRDGDRDHRDNDYEKSNSKHSEYKFTIDQLFPSETNKSGTSAKRLDINSLFSGTSMDKDVRIEMSHEILLKRKKKRKEELQRQYMLEYKRCWDKIDAADGDGFTETFFDIVKRIPNFPEYDVRECIDTIQSKLRNEYLDVVELNEKGVLFINWDNIEENKKNDRNISYSDTDSESRTINKHDKCGKKSYRSEDNH